MKKYLILGIALGLIFALNAWAATTTLTGKVTVINQDSTNSNIGSFSIIKNLNWLQKLTGTIFNRAIETPITLQVTEGSKFYLRTSATTGFTEGSFQDLKVNDQVNVLTDVRTAYGTLPSNNYTVYTALEVKITGRFIPVPKTIPAITQCQTDTDCTWCGMNCVLKTTLKDRMCAQVMPKEGTECKCVFVLPTGVSPTTVTTPDEKPVPLPTYGICKPVSSTSPSTTLVSHNNTITINRALTLGLIQDLSDKKMIQVIDSNLQNLYRIIITPQTKLKIGSITDGGDWLNIGLPKLNAEPKTWYDLKWSEFPKEGSAIIKVDGIIKDKTCYIDVDADTVYFYSVNIDPGCPSGQ